MLWPRHLDWDYCEPGRKPEGRVKIDYSAPLAKYLVAYYLDNENLINSQQCTLNGNIAVNRKDGFICDGTGDYAQFDTKTRAALTFGLEDFTIITKVKWNGNTSLFPAVISNGDTAGGEWMLRYGGVGWNFYADSGGYNIGFNHTPVVGAKYYIAVSRLDGDIYIYAWRADFSRIGSNSQITGNRNLSTSNIYAGIGGADNNSSRWWKGNIELAIVYRGIGLTESMIIDVIKSPEKYLEPG